MKGSRRAGRGAAEGRRTRPAAVRAERLRLQLERAVVELGTSLLAAPGRDDLRARLAGDRALAQQAYRALLRRVCRTLLLRLAGARGVASASPGDEDLRDGERDGERLLAGLAREVLPRALRGLAIDPCRDGGSPEEGGPEGEVGAEDLGGAYASLLELHPRIDVERGVFTLETAAGHARKTSGSYYTPAPLVESLLAGALDPLLDAAMAAPDPEQALLGLTVCDPACGSGRLLLAAARRIAGRLATVRAGGGGEPPAPAARQAALHDTVERCIYGVDADPLAVELCRLGLWLEAGDGDRPLAGPARHVRCGNALLGATPALLAAGIPDAAFCRLEGDDPAVTAALRRRNRAERRQGRGGDGGGGSVAEEGVARLQADAWAAAFLWRKDDAGLLEAAPTQAYWQRLASAPETCSPRTRAEVQRLATEHRFFHWQLEFPEVLRLPGAGEAATDPEAGWSGGFDCVVGNPPWERVKFQEKEWIAQHLPAAARAQDAACRKQQLGQASPELLAAWRRGKRAAEGEYALLRSSGRYPRCGRRDINSYALFCELACSLLSGRGRAALIVPTGLATGETTGPFFRDLLARRRLVSLYDFSNREGLFPGVTGLQRFCLLTLAGQELPRGEPARCLFGATRVEELRDERRIFTLDAGDVAAVNPLSGSCPVFGGPEDAEITKGIYRRLPPLGGAGGASRAEGAGGAGAWQVALLRLLDMTNDAGLLGLRQPGSPGRDESLLPVYEGKMVAMYDHRAASIEFRGDNELRQQQPVLHGAAAHADPSFCNEAYLGAQAALVQARLGVAGPVPWFLVFKRVTSAANMRTLVGCVLPWCAVSYTLYVVRVAAAQQRFVPALLANLCSFVADYLVRQKTTQPSLPMGVVHETPFVSPAALDRPAPWCPDRSVLEWLRPRSVELCYGSWDLQRFARDFGCSGPPFPWDEERRFLLRCELDAAFFHLYGLGRPQVAHVLETFPIVRRREFTRWGEYRTQRTILELFDRLGRSAGGGRPYP